MVKHTKFNFSLNPFPNLQSRALNTGHSVHHENLHGKALLPLRLAPATPSYYLAMNLTVLQTFNSGILQHCPLASGSCHWTIHSRPTHVVACVRLSLLFKAEGAAPYGQSALRCRPRLGCFLLTRGSAASARDRSLWDSAPNPACRPRGGLPGPHSSPQEPHPSTAARSAQASSAPAPWPALPSFHLFVS